MKTLKITLIALLLGSAGIAGAQTQPGLTVSVAAPATVSTGADRAIATVALHAEGSDVRLESLPISLGYSNTVADPFGDCALRQAATGPALNTGSNAIGAQGSGDFEVVFDTPAIVPANTTAVLILTCDIPASIPDGNAVATSIFVSQVEATSGGSSVSVAGSDPQTGATNRPVGITTISSNTPGIPNTGGPATPGIPNTGAGGDMILWTTLALLALVGAGVTGYVLWRRA